MKLILSSMRAMSISRDVPVFFSLSCPSREVLLGLRTAVPSSSDQEEEPAAIRLHGDTYDRMRITAKIEARLQTASSRLADIRRQLSGRSWYFRCLSRLF